MRRFSAYWTEELGQSIQHLSTDDYPIECHDNTDDFKVLTNAVRQGIDAHLEAIFFHQSIGQHGRIRLIFESKSMPVLIRRLLESDDERAQMLASGICDTLGIELV